MNREGTHLHIEVLDDGVGIGAEGIHQGLGTKIVRTMIEGELRGSIEWKNRAEGGTGVYIEFDVADVEP